ncbi:MAG: alpha/beta hydrolase [Deltaproteobacteria bacterium]|nr:alpha/beta hydrolase [Deltaproteobacteria bacterium]
MAQSIYKTKDGKNKILNSYDEFLNKWPVPFDSEYIETSYGRTHLLKCGETEKPPLFLLHGTGTNLLMWMGDIENYCKKFRVCLVDIIGEPGRSDETRLSLKDGSHGLWLKEIIKKSGYEKVNIAGYSIGGWMALNFAVNFPEMVNKLVLFAPSGIYKPKVIFIFKAMFYMFLGKYGQKKINQILTNNREMDYESFEFGLLVSKYFRWRLDQIPVYTDTQLGNLNMPVLYIGGEKDSLLYSTESAKRLQSILPESRVRIVANGGHVLFDLYNKCSEFISL